MLPETRDALARYDAWLARTVKSPDHVAAQARRLERATRSVGRRLRNMILGVFAVVLGGNKVRPVTVAMFNFISVEQTQWARLAAGAMVAGRSGASALGALSEV